MKNKICLLLATVSFSFTAFCQLPANTPTNGLLGFWTFDNTASDASGNNNNGFSSNVTPVVDRNGVANKAYGFNGFSSVVTIPSSVILEQGSTRTFAFWAKVPSGTVRTIFHKTSGGMPYIYYGGYASGQEIFFRTSASVNPPVLYGGLVGTVVNGWNHIVFAYDNQLGILKQYRNGQFVNEVTGLGANSMADPIGNELLIGKGHQGQNGEGYPYDGELDDFGIWDRVLDECEIAKMYLSSNLITTQPTAPFGAVNGSTQISIQAPTGATFQWQTNNGSGFLDINNTGQFSGATSNTLTISNLTLLNDQQPFRCEINFGTCSVISDSVKLFISPASVNDVSEIVNISLNPNPASNSLTIKVDPLLINKNIQVLNTLGQIVFTGNIKAEINLIDLSSFPEGNYFVKIDEKDAKSFMLLR